MATLFTPVKAGVPPADSTQLVAVYVWEWPVRIAHWLLVGSLIVLTVTGFYMHSPFVEAHGSRAWVMGTARFLHELFGFFLISILILRFYWFFAGNRWAHWRAFVPLTRAQWAGAASMIKYYAYRSREPLPEIGHNPLAAMSYLVIFSLLALECITGLILYSHVVANRTLASLVNWVPRIVDIQYIRATHFLVMFFFMAFLVHHVYSAVLVSMEQKNGLMESIFSGWKFVSRKLLTEDVSLAEKLAAAHRLQPRWRIFRGKR